MKTKVIEVTVTGECGTGKSEVLEVIQKALHEFYGKGTRIKIAGKDATGAIDSARHTGQTAKDKDTILVLRENVVARRPRNEGPDYN